jgi:hypothetical protein
MANEVDPLAVYFASHLNFDYDSSAPAIGEFDRLVASLGLDTKDKAFKQERKRFTDAFAGHVSLTYGEGRGTLEQWQSLCDVCGISPIPASRTKCRKVSNASNQRLR